MTSAAAVRIRRTRRLRQGELVVLAAVLAGAALRFATIAHQSLDEDETVSVWLMHHSFIGMLRDVPRTESTPPLFYVLEWLWTRVFGTGAAAMRSLPAVAGVATIPVFAMAVRELAGRRAAAIAAVLAALSPALVWYSQEARAYALLILFSAASMFWVARALASPQGHNRRALGWWAAYASLALASHYFAVFVVAGEIAWLLAARGTVSRRDVVRPLAFVAGTAVVLAPRAYGQSTNGGSGWIGDIPLWGRITDVPPQMMLGEGRPLLPWSFATAVAIPLLVPAAFALVRGSGAVRRAIALPLSVGLAATALPVLIDLAGKHILLDRNTLGAGVVLLLGCVVAMGRTSWLGLVAAALVACLFAWDIAMGLTNPRMQREPWSRAAHALGQADVPRAIVFGPNVSNPAPAPPLITFQAVYLKSMLTYPDRGRPVREIDELDVRDDLSDTSPRPDPVSPGKGWRLVARAGDQTYTLYRFQSPRPRLFTADQLFAKNLLANRDSGDQLIGLQLPRRG